MPTPSVVGLPAPNVVLFFVDDLGYGDPGFTGSPSARTPHLDSLVSRGKRLTNWYSGYPVCSASRTALLTGRQPPRVGMVGVINSLTAVGLPLSEVTLADELRKANYTSLALGKWHQGQQPQYLPMRRGFDEFLGLPFSVDDGAGYLSPCNGTSGAAAEDAAIEAAAVEQPARLGSGLGPLLPLPLIEQRAAERLSRIVEQPTDLRLLTSRLTEHALGFLRRAHAGRFFVYFAFGHVHTATAAISADRQYAGCAFAGTGARPFVDALSEVDDAVGRVLGELDRLGVGGQTLTLFTSDNGPSLRWGGGAGTVGPFAGASAAYANGTRYQNTAKGSTWEGGVRMPAFAHWPGVIAPGSVAYTTVSTLDVLPSLLHLAGRPLPTDRVLDGTLSLADALLARAPDAPSRHAFLPLYNEPAYANASRRIFAARCGPYKAHWITSPGLGGGIMPYRSPAPEATHPVPIVYDVRADPAEAFPLAPPPDGLLEALEAHKQEAERALAPRAIDARWGYEFALCCGVGCTPPCRCRCKDVPLPV